MESIPQGISRLGKRTIIEGKTTLDNLHQVKMGDMRREEGMLDIVIEHIAKLEAEIPTIGDVVAKTHKEEELAYLTRKKGDLISKDSVYDYFFNTGEILFNYYDLQDKIQCGVSTVAKHVKVKPGSVLASLREKEVSPFQNNEHPILANSQPEGRDVLLEKYIQKVNPENAKTQTNLSEDPHGMCERCDLEMKFSPIEALFFCETCGFQEFVLIDSDKPSYKDPPREITYYAYKRINHFNEWLAQFQAKESTEIPEDIFQAIMEELKKERIISVEEIKQVKIREILKKLKCTNFYEHVPYILNRINGKTAPVMSREIEEKLRFMFKEIQSSFVKHCPKTRSNFLSYSYVLYKFCELLELDEYLKCFPLLKNRDKLYNQDKIWERICTDLRWQFIKSI